MSQLEYILYVTLTIAGLIVSIVGMFKGYKKFSTTLLPVINKLKDSVKPKNKNILPVSVTNDVAL